MLRLYYAHAMLKYHTPQEAAELALLAAHFPDTEIINPALVRNRGRGMETYFALVREADFVAFSTLAYRDLDDYPRCSGARRYKENLMGAGVYAEICCALKAGKPLYRIFTDRVEPWSVRPRILRVNNPHFYAVA